MDTSEILVVDDRPEIRFLLQAQLKKLGKTCDQAEDGQEAVERYKSHQYPMIFMDLAMPRLDGLGATRQIREFEMESGKERAVIIAVTGQGERQECIAAGMDDFTEKPVLIKTLRTFIEKWLPQTC
ncbi:MAG TPA: response regulator [Drouetiella sp.]